MFTTFSYWIFAFLLLFNSHNSSTLDSLSPKDFQNYVFYATDQKIDVDGKLDEEVWEKAPFSNLFVDIEGAIKPAPLHNTKFKMLWDSEYLYIGARMEEPHIWATYIQRESVIFHENDFEIFIDPNGDTHNYYEVEVNALNTIWDLMLSKPYRDGGKAINSWDVKGMKSAVYLEGTNNDASDVDAYWSVEFALPWSALKEYAFEHRKPNDGEQWRINFSRVQWRLDIIDGKYKKRINPETEKAYPEYNWVWSPQGAINMHQPETWGYVQFSDILVGNDKTEFVFDEEELPKWELRKIYYAQKKYRKEHLKFTSNLTELEFEGEYFNNPSIELTASKSDFLAKLKQTGTQKTWMIRADGFVWIE
jgi:hypothetical protein